MFEFSAPTRVVFGSGALERIGELASGLGRRALVVTGRSARSATRLTDLIRNAGISSTTFVTAGEPDVDMVRRGADAAREADCDFVIGLGGGSAIDASKAIAALTTNRRDLFDYLEVIGRGQPLSHAPLPSVAIPTTAGTGSEVTRNAVLFSPEHRVKVSLRSPLMLPRLAIVDPDLTVDLPPALTASTGLDALTQVIEPYLSRRATPLTDPIAVEGIRHAAQGLRRAFRDGHDREARIAMAFASVCGGLALANAGLGAVHGFAAPIGGMFDAPHGMICAALLPHVMAANLQALETRALDHPARPRFRTIAALLTGQPSARAEDAVEWVRALVTDLAVPPLRTFGLATSDIPAVVDKASRASSMKGNPIDLTPEELAAVLAAAL